MKKPRTLPQTQFLTVDQVAAYYGVHHETVRAWVREGHVEALRVGPRLLRIHRDQLAKIGRPTDGAA